LNVNRGLNSLSGRISMKRLWPLRRIEPRTGIRGRGAADFGSAETFKRKRVIANGWMSDFMYFLVSAVSIGVG
jgi:hypothetical protein